ncbi:hypothetical protein [Spelaeicoccus albus]|uniref:Uncharacterized protein n=1 Tax=Spelaeicoccus albus TaxID=1280376 RepID=A0A7Z0A8Z7_9MICO|nr:hypothetical protein [Spelaeicoccus albus]NYI65821.1 hypothetical protein [Spelaeicoccus albus]
MTSSAAQPRAADDEAGPCDEAALSDDVRAARRPPTQTIPARRPAADADRRRAELGAATGPALLRQYGATIAVAASAVVLVAVVVRACRR